MRYICNRESFKINDILYWSKASIFRGLLTVVLTRFNFQSYQYHSEYLSDHYLHDQHPHDASFCASFSSSSSCFDPDHLECLLD